ncbi:MAG TPA: hypothetical protein VJ814_08770, partial [Gaiellaceae bacterium]|nr:hypothetical protein [Gaiellaceae bacterium]
MSVRAGIAALLALAAGASAEMRVVARIGDASPLGLPFSRFSEAAIDDRGRIAFVGASTVLFERTSAGIVHLLGAGDALDGREIAGVGPPALAG